jgi:hypothetical protein
LGGDAQGDSQGRALHDLIDYKPSDSLTRRLATDLRQCLECSRLFRDQPVGAETR